MTRPRPRPGRQPPRKIASLPCSTRRRRVPAIKAAVPSVLSNAGLDGSRSVNRRSPMPSQMDVRRAVSLRRRSPVEVFLDIGAIVLRRGHSRAAPDRRWHAYTLPGTANIGHDARTNPPTALRRSEAAGPPTRASARQPPARLPSARPGAEPAQSPPPKPCRIPVLPPPENAAEPLGRPRGNDLPQCPSPGLIMAGDLQTAGANRALAPDEADGDYGRRRPPPRPGCPGGPLRGGQYCTPIWGSNFKAD